VRRASVCNSRRFPVPTSPIGKLPLLHQTWRQTAKPGGKIYRVNPHFVAAKQQPHAFLSFLHNKLPQHRPPPQEQKTRSDVRVIFHRWRASLALGRLQHGQAGLSPSPPASGKEEGETRLNPPACAKRPGCPDRPCRRKRARPRGRRHWCDRWWRGRCATRWARRSVRTGRRRWRC